MHAPNHRAAPSLRQVAKTRADSSPAAVAAAAAATATDRRLSHEQASTSEPPAAAKRLQAAKERKAAKAATAKARAAQASPPGSATAAHQPRFSTGVNLLDPGQAQASAKANGALHGGDGSSRGATAECPPALRKYPALLQAFMARQGFDEPTPIQEQVWFWVWRV